MPTIPPRVDSRTADDIARQVSERIPGWETGAPSHGAAAALIRVFARYAELVVERVNHVPARNQLAFLGYIGASRLAPQPARVPLTFRLAPGSSRDVAVPAGTRVSSVGTDEQPPVLFETEQSIVVTAARLDRLLVREPAQDRYADRASLLTDSAERPVEPFHGDRSIEHTLYVGHSTFFGARPVNELSVAFDVAEPLTKTPQAVSWELWDGTSGLALAPVEDTTAGLTHTGAVVFHDVNTVAAGVVGGRQARWLRCRLDTPVVRATVVNSITLQRELHEEALRPEAGFANNVPVDLTKDFLPLGRTPVFGDVFYLANARAFSLKGATVKLAVTLTNPAARVDVPLPRVNITGDAHVAWEFWNGTVWCELGTGRASEDVRADATDFADTTRGLTQSGEVTFRFLEQPQPTTLLGIASYWIRARLTSGHYGQDTAYVPIDPIAPKPEYALKPSTLAAPSVKRIEVSYWLKETAQPPEAVLAHNDFELEDGTMQIVEAKSSLAVFKPTLDRKPALYFGFLPPAGKGFSESPVCLYLEFAGAAHALSTRGEHPKSPTVVWEYWSDKQSWSRMSVRDHTGAMTRSGMVLVRPPDDFVPKTEFGEVRYWLRALWRGAPGDTVSRLRRVLLNTTDASQTITIRGEVLGSSQGTAHQVFRVSRPPVLHGPRVVVREDGGPGLSDSDAGWTRWEEVPDFYASGSGDRHCVLDHVTGEVTFGDGAHGLIPPAGRNNVRMAEYRTGGGAAGNLPPHRITQLKTTIPSLSSVTNEEPSTGGADAETVEGFVERAPRGLRHQGRAVTAEDYEDLARLASPGVARARCVPLRNLAVDPEATRVRPGTVSVIVVPRSDDTRPLPSVELLNRVQAYLGARQSPSTELIVLGPEYVLVDVEADVRVRSLERINEIEVAIKAALGTFLHPLRGGPGGMGWDFGREPHRSDMYSLIGATPGVDHVHAVRVMPREERRGARLTKRFLVSPGTFTLFFDTL